MMQVCGMCLRDLCMNVSSGVLRIKSRDRGDQAFACGSKHPEDFARIISDAHELGDRVEINDMIVGPPVTTYMGTLMCSAHLLNAPHPAELSQRARSGRW